MAQSAPKKRVTFLQAIASPTFSYAPGSKAAIEASLADAWEASGIVSIDEETPAPSKK